MALCTLILFSTPVAQISSSATSPLYCPHTVFSLNIPPFDLLLLLGWKILKKSHCCVLFKTMPFICFKKQASIKKKIIYQEFILKRHYKTVQILVKSMIHLWSCIPKGQMEREGNWRWHLKPTTIGQALCILLTFVLVRSRW